MGRSYSTGVRLFALLAVTAGSSASLAQERPAPLEVKSMCPSIIATVMVSKVACTAALCNTGASQGGLAGLLTQYVIRGSIDAESFSNAVGAQLATALTQTGCFAVVDAASLEATKREMEALGRPAPPPPAVDYIVRASVTKAEYSQDETGFMGFKKVTASSSLTIDTKLVNAQTGTVSEAGSYDATIDRASSGVSILGYSSSSDAAKKGVQFAEVSRDAAAKGAIGLTTKIVSQQVPAKPSPLTPPQSPPIGLPATTPQ